MLPASTRTGTLPICPFKLAIAAVATVDAQDIEACPWVSSKRCFPYCGKADPCRVGGRSRRREIVDPASATARAARASAQIGAECDLDRSVVRTHLEEIRKLPGLRAQILARGLDVSAEMRSGVP